MRVGENITFAVTLTSLGPLRATGIVIGDHLPRELALVSCSCNTGNVTDASFCEVVRLESGQSTAATIVATPVDDLAPAENELSLTTKALVAEFLAFDPDRENNTASLSVQVLVTPPADQAHSRWSRVVWRGSVVRRLARSFDSASLSFGYNFTTD